MEGRATLRSRLAPLFARHAASRGVDLEPILMEHSAPLDLATREEIAIALPTFRSLTQALAEAARDPRFGLHAALEAPRGSYGLIEYLVRNAATVRALIHALVRFESLINDISRVDFDDRTGRLVEHIPGDAEYLGRHGNEFAMVHQLRVGREVAGFPIVLEQVTFAHEREVDDRELADALGTRNIEYGGGKNVARISQDVLNTPIATADPSLLRVLEEQARSAVKKRPGDGLDAYRELIAAELLSGEPTASRIARATGTSERTLLRQLTARGTTFRALLDEVRRDLAIQYLADATRTVEDVALMLGYSDTRAFARAFHRLTGKTPREWRRQNGGEWC